MKQEPKSKSEMESLVTVLTPVHNGEKYIAECIESVLAQTYTKWEYVIQDNQSCDRTWEIASTYSERDRRIRVIKTEVFLPVIDNFNDILKKVSHESKYCKFVCADDWLFPECLEHMVEIMEKYRDVGIVGAYGSCGGTRVFNGLPPEEIHFEGKEIARDILLKKYSVIGSPTSTLLRTETVKIFPFYDNRFLHADKAAGLILLQNWNFGFCHKILTFTRLHSESKTATVREIFGTHLVEDFAMVNLYGPKVLKKKELEKSIKIAKNEYYRYLGKNIIKMRGKKFWKLHKEKLHSFGIRFDCFALMVGVITVLSRAIVRLVFFGKRVK